MREGVPCVLYRPCQRFAIIMLSLPLGPAMANVTVRNIEDDVIAALKAQAKANHRSLEGEIRHVLAQQAGRGSLLEDFRERTERLRALTTDVPQTDSTILLREDRDR